MPCVDLEQRVMELEDVVAVLQQKTETQRLIIETIQEELRDMKEALSH